MLLTIAGGKYTNDYNYSLVNKHSYGKSLFSMGKSTINGNFQYLAMSVYQRVRKVVATKIVLNNVIELAPPSPGMNLHVLTLCPKYPISSNWSQISRVEAQLLLVNSSVLYGYLVAASPRSCQILAYPHHIPITYKIHSLTPWKIIILADLE